MQQILVLLVATSMELMAVPIAGSAHAMLYTPNQVQLQSSSSDVDWAIGGYSNASGYNSYQFQWTPTSLNSSSINYGGILLNVPITATGTYYGASINGVWMQAVVNITRSGTYHPAINYRFSSTSAILSPPIILKGFSFVTIPVNGSMAFLQLNYTAFKGFTGWWYILGVGAGVLPSSITYLAGFDGVAFYCLTSSGTYQTISVGNIAQISIGDTGDVLQMTVSGHKLFVSPSIGLEINEPSSGDVTAKNPAFLAYGSFFASNSYINNVYYANSSSYATDLGFAAGAGAPPSTMAGSGATVTFPNTSDQYSEGFGTPKGMQDRTSTLSTYTQVAGTDLTSLNTIHVTVPVSSTSSTTSSRASTAEELI
ncbi:MAG: hypothetical protein JRN53_03790 [Nitrososphaerota archaeon]|nr:hypothetical protein [Nitrososphaerota archaeon]MDG7041782.1 hypothetical protein [Nitrososphaerota archaeon]MDG7046694.1 hypothetical protein [Nitrososphaerota archaeon]